MRGTFTIFDWSILVAYFVVIMGVGAFFYRRSQKSSSEFTTGGRQLPTWLCGLSIYATFLSSITFLGLPGKAYASDWSAFVFSLTLPLAAWIAIRWFVPYYRRSTDVSAYTMLEKRFGLWARWVASLSFLGFHVARMAFVMYLMGLPLAFIFNWDVRFVILVTGLSVIVYTTIGGIVAVMWADAIQAVVLTVGAVVSVVVLLMNLPEGPQQVFTIAAEQTPHKFSLGSFDWRNWSGPTFFVMLSFGVFDNLRNFGIDQSYIQRYVSAESDVAARRSVWFSAWLYLPVSALFLFIGTSLFAFYQQHPVELAELHEMVQAQTPADPGTSTPHPTNVSAEANAATPATAISPQKLGDNVFPHFIAKSLPTGIKGLLVAAIFSAAMSTISTSLNSCATVLMSDFYVRGWNPSATDRQRIQVLQMGSVGLGVLGTAGAFGLVRLTASAMDVWWTISSILGAAILGLFLLGLLVPRASRIDSLGAFFCGGLVIGWMIVSQSGWWPATLQAFASPIDNRMVVVIGSMSIVAAGYCLSLVRRTAK